jgi:hypothetical protein
MLNVAAYPHCARILHYQQANLADPAMTYYWAAACVASAQSDTLMTEFGGFNFDDRSPENGKKQLVRMEAFLRDKGHQSARNHTLASEGLKALLGSRGIKTSELKSEDDYWTAAETLFPGHIKRIAGLSSLYTQITAIPKKLRGELGRANLGRIPEEWLGKIVDRRVIQTGAAA